MDRAGQSTFHTLDGIRGFGALIVCYAHSDLLFSHSIYRPLVNPIAVDLFFILSGFVLAYAYEPRFRTGMSALNFMQQRLIRLYPIYLLGLVLGFTVHAIALLDDTTPHWGDLFKVFSPQLLMLPAPPTEQVNTLYPLNAPAWTLLFELSINFLYVLIFPWLTVRRLLAIIAVSAGLFVWAAYSLGTNSLGVTWDGLLGGFPRAATGFFIGVLLFRLNGSPKAPSLKRSVWSAVAVVCALLLCFFPIVRELRGVPEVFVIVFVVSLAVQWAQKIEPPKWLVPTFVWFGTVSYAFYMLHAPLLDVLVRLDWRLEGKLLMSAPFTGIALIIVVLGISWAADKFYDRPVRRWLTRLAKGRKRRVAQQQEPGTLRGGKAA